MYLNKKGFDSYTDAWWLRSVSGDDGYGVGCIDDDGDDYDDIYYYSEGVISVCIIN